MKLKYYLRGLGIGIIVTAAIMSVTKKTEELTDAEIKMRALELGMVEENVLADLQQENKEASPINKKEDNYQKEAVKSEENFLDESADKQDADYSEEQNSILADENSEKEVLENKTEMVENYIIISVESGVSSQNVSRKLFEAGLVESAMEYNDFLVSHGYDRRLSAGNYEIPVGVSKEEIARILCGLE